MTERERSLEITMVTLAVIIIVLCGLAIFGFEAMYGRKAAMKEGLPLFGHLFIWGIPTMLLAVCSRCVRDRKFARWIMAGCWLLMCLLLCGMGAFVPQLRVYLDSELVYFPALTFLTGPLAIWTVRWRNGWRITLWSFISLPIISCLITCVVLSSLGLVEPW